jgi:CRP/FNR family transcriptional regulator, anaerobic regulatory protein
MPEFETSLYGLISRELVREQGMIRMLAGLNAEVKLARFLVALSQRYAELGYSGKNFTLRMTRRDIGRYLGLSMESVCRVLNIFADLRLIDIEKRDIVLRDIRGLKEMRRLKLRRGH